MQGGLMTKEALRIL